MLKKIIITLTLFLAISFTTNAQNIMLIPNVSGNAKDTIEVALEINNNDPFVAFQTDIELPNVVSYLNNSAQLTSRADGHMVTANVLNGNILRIIAFSLAQKNFIGNVGSVINFKLVLGSTPGDYALVLLNPIISNQSSANILTSSNNGTLTIVAPNISSNISNINFGEIPLLQSLDMNLTIYNNGNSSLNVSRIYINNPYFKIIGDTTFVISASSNKNVTIRFNSTVKGSYTPNLIIQSNDPDESGLSVSLSAIAFAVNELHMQSASGRSGYHVTLGFSLNNMENFVGFQFDMNLPSVLTYLPDSVWLSSRKTDHVISANIVSGNILRVVAFSPTNSAFKGNDGDIITIKFMLAGNGGNYNVPLDNVVITNNIAENIISEFYSSYVNIASPDISGQTTINLGEVSVLDTASYYYQLSNTGNDTLTVTNFSSPQQYFWAETPLPLKINPGEQKSFLIKFSKNTKGNYTDRFIVRSNDPDEDPFYINVAATSFEPNYISLNDTSVAVGDTLILPILIQNHEAFVAFQVDLFLPDSLEYIPNSGVLSNRAQGHAFSVGNINNDPSKLRLFAFSINQRPFSGNNGAVAYLKFKVKNNIGNFPLDLQNGIVSDAQSNNINKATLDGLINIELGSLVFNIKIYLQGPFLTGSLKREICSLGYLRLTQPYNTSPWNYTGIESVSTIPNDVVDWVLIELRSTTTTVVGKKVVFIKNDGTLVNSDGSIPINFENIESGSYYIVIHHRNHLSIMSKNPVALSENTVLYDFTTGQEKAYGSSPMKDLGGGVYGMIAGDANGDGTVGYSDDILSNWLPNFGLNGYKSADLNMNGEVDYSNDILQYWLLNFGLSTQVPGAITSSYIEKDKLMDLKNIIKPQNRK